MTSAGVFCPGGDCPGGGGECPDTMIVAIQLSFTKVINIGLTNRVQRINMHDNNNNDDDNDNDDNNNDINNNNNNNNNNVLVVRLRTLLFDEDEKYRKEAEMMVPTTLDRLAENRERLKELRDSKEKQRLELVQQKYLQQARYILSWHHAHALERERERE